MHNADLIAALESARQRGMFGGPFGGVAAPPFLPSKYYWPHYLEPMTAPLTITANRLYRAWMFVGETTTFAGGWFFNSGTGDTGLKLRIGVWDRLGALLKDFGETTLNGSAALRAVANSVTIAPGLIQVGLVSDTAPSLRSMRAAGFLSAAGVVSVNPLANLLGVFSGQAATGGDGQRAMPVGDYAAFTYGALPTPITPATATILASNNADSSAGDFPAFGLYMP